MRRMRSPLAIFALSAMAALTLVGPALAARPAREIIDVGTPEIEAIISANMTGWCGFGISVDADATIAITVFSNKDGTFRREIDHSQIKWTLTNVATGVSIRVHNVGPDIYWVNRDGSLMHAIMGRSYVVHDGVGFIGRVLINEDTGEVVAFSGHQTGDIQQLVCTPLAA